MSLINKCTPVIFGNPLIPRKTSFDGLRVGVVGAGVVGMTLARIAQDQFKKAAVTVIADRYKKDTTSSVVVCGVFRPGTDVKAYNPAITKEWVDESWFYWQNILKTAEAPAAGIMAVSCYMFSKENEHIMRNHFLEDLLPIYRPVTAKELQIPGKGWKYGTFFSSLIVSCEKYLPWAEAKFIAAGGNIVKKRVQSLGALKDKYDLVFNCTGLGAKLLCNDHDLVPMRGQIVTVRAPWLKTGFYGDYDIYVIPGFDGVATLGGTRQYDSYNSAICKHDAAAILERCCELVPGLKKAEVVGHKVGLRPHRTPVRVEKELINGLKVVHCYGHGGYGVTCAPGTAAHAVMIGLDLCSKKI